MKNVNKMFQNAIFLIGHVSFCYFVPRPNNRDQKNQLIKDSGLRDRTVGKLNTVDKVCSSTKLIFISYHI